MRKALGSAQHTAKAAVAGAAKQPSTLRNVAKALVDRPARRTNATKPDEYLSGLALHSAIVHDGISVMKIKELATQLGLAEDDLGLRCGLSRPTLHRRRKAEGRLSGMESDVLSRHAMLLKQATDVMTDEEAARNWLRSPQLGLAGHIPLDLALTTTGFREVEKLLTRIDYGVYA